MGPGLPGAWVHAGPVAHVGLGVAFTPGVCSSGEAGPGWAYNVSGEARGTGDLYFLLIHGAEGGHRCWGLLPGLQSVIDGGPWSRSPLHVCDVDARVHVLFFGVRAGFSPGEFLDFLLGSFGVDLAGDDSPEGRRDRRPKGG